MAASRGALREAADWEDGLTKALHGDYDAIVLDVIMPGISGFAVLEQLRVRKKTPVLMFTARNRTPDRVFADRISRAAP